MLNIELSDLVFFQAVAQHGGITNAAKRLHCVPSNVSTRIKQLEQSLAVTLFIREAKTLRLSSQGRSFLEYAKRIVALATEAQDSMISSEPQGVLRLGSMDSLAAIRERLEAWIINGEASLPRIIELTSYHAILGCVAAGMGIGFVPQIVLDGFANNDGLTKHQIGARWSKMETAVVWRDGADSPRLTAFRQLLAARTPSRTA